ncbi:MAG: PilZ domain-containing protein [Thermodesulfobacteriota bacterium]
MQDQERRQKKRVRFKTGVVLKTEWNEFSADAHSRDISLDGIFIQTDAPLEIGQFCELDITLSGTSSKLQLTVKGRVVRREDQGIAIKFTEFDIDSYIHLKNLVLYNIQAPDSVGDDLL